MVLSTKMNKITLTADAQSDMDDIRSYIAGELGSPKAAASVLRRISKTIRILRTYAFAGAPLSARFNIGKDYRFLVSGNYLVFYHIEEQEISVDRIMNGRQNYIEKLFHGEIDEPPEE